MGLHSLPVPGRIAVLPFKEVAMYINTHTHGCLGISLLSRLETRYF